MQAPNKLNPIVVKCGKAVLVLFISALLAVCLVGFFSILYAWNFSNPGCKCPSEKIYVSRLLWETHRHTFEAIAVGVMLVLAFVLTRVCFTPRVVKSLVAGTIAGTIGYFVFQSIFEPTLSTQYFLPISVPTVVSFDYKQLAEVLFDPLFTWKFLVALGLFVLACLIGWLLQKRSCSNPLSTKLQAES